MAASEATVSLQPRRHSRVLGALDWVAVDGSDGINVPVKSGDVVYARNTHATLAKTLTVVAVANRGLGRPHTGNAENIQAFSLPALGAEYVLPLLLPDGWLNATTHKVHATGSSVDVEIAVARSGW